MTKKKKLSPYSLVIDQEGFPVMNGYRVDDSSFLKKVFPHIKRLLEGENRSPLVVEIDSQLVRVDAFDAPLVAQMVDQISPEGAFWIFPGNHQVWVEHSELSIDPWNRLHAYIGESQIPAVLSRKAQQELLLKGDFSLEFPAFRKIVDRDVNEEAFWTRCYDEGGDGWELGVVSPTLVHYELSFLKPGSSIAVPGAGRGHEIDYFEKQGFLVTGIDVSQRAQQEFFKLYPQSRSKFEVDDLFQYFPQKKSMFSGIFELNVLCAIDPQKRAEYIEILHHSLKDEAFYFGAFLLRSSPGGPPFGLTQWELKELTKKYFKILQWELSPASVPQRKGLELWAVLQRE